MLNTASRIPRHASRITHHDRGIALVVTLLLLSIITFMVVTFLVVSRSQKGSVTTATDQAIARLAADMALERAKAAIIAPMLAWTNEFSYGLVVSTNYINAAGFDQSLPLNGIVNPTNVNYDYTMGGAALNRNQQQQNIANLLYDARPPVFIATNRSQLTPPEFRFYLDVNRSGRYDANGLQPEIVRDASGALGFYDLNGNFIPYQWPPPPNIVIVSNFFIGDPEWIGTLERPEYAHSADNKFINRYAYYVVPIGNMLDLNAIHNQAKFLGPLNEGFSRNEGVGTWELNLAAFLADLNTNFWPFPFVSPPPFGFQPYFYNTNSGQFSTGTAFEDSLALLRYRYNGTYNNLNTFRGLYGNLGVNALLNSGIDGYSAGPVMDGFYLPVPNALPGSWYWAGADNPQHFYTTQELFDKSKTGTNAFSFSDRLRMAGTNNDSYNRYTFARLTAQLGTDSSPEPGGKLNLNYRNVDDYGNVVPDMATNFIAWEATRFFTNAANRLLADAGFKFTTANIQVWPTNFYTPSVHRLLQVAANMYDATTNRMDLSGYPYLPSVFYPRFTNDNNVIYINGYEEAKDTSFMNLQICDLQISPGRDAIRANGNVLVYGVPAIVGAKKGLPNFNELAMQTQVQVTRKLQFRRPAGSTIMPVNQTNQMFVASISNVFGVEAWNSYPTNFPRELRLTVMPDVSMFVTNEANIMVASNRYSPSSPTVTNILAGAWPAYDPGQEQYSFIVPVLTNVIFLSNAVYSPGTRQFVTMSGVFEPASPAFYVPHWWLNLRIRLRVALIDVKANRVVDYVNLDAIEPTLDLTTTMMAGGTCGDDSNPTYTVSASDGSMWCTNHHPSQADESLPTYGILNQIEGSLGRSQPNWNSALNEFPNGLNRAGAIDFFRHQFDLGTLTYSADLFQKTNTFNAPFQPTRNVFLLTTWQVNDPLVHYTVGDLLDLNRPNRVAFDTNSATLANLSRVNERYQPWGWEGSRSSSPTKTALQVKDPVVLRSDSWDFPTNKYPNVGWLGRVHRGTPWQTAYLKSPGTDLATWQKWTGNNQFVTNVGQFPTNLMPLYVPGTLTGVAPDAYFSQPTNDWRLLDLFTTALNDNATRSQLSINQTNLAAWSAVLSGVMVLTNSLDSPDGSPIYDANDTPMLFPLTIQPAGVYDAFSPPNTWPGVAQIVRRINEVRATNSLRHVFARLSDLLVVPELSVASPFLYTNVPDTARLYNYGLNDAAYERLPQQIAGLLKADPTPRFAVYSFGQTLRPADKSLVTSSGSFFGLCTNYQIMAESATRAIIRIEGAPANPQAVVESFNLLPPD